MPTTKRHPIIDEALYNHVNSISLTAWYVACFPQIVENPKVGLWKMAPVLAVLQAVWCVLGVERLGEKKGRKEKYGQKVLTAVLSLLLTTTLGTAILFAGLILFGAPVTSLQLETLGCAMHMALLAGFPLVYTLGVDAAAWKEVIALQRGWDSIYVGAVGSVVGAWAGAGPIPLDWDREWQQWPVTILTGAYGGWIFGKTVGCIFGRTRAT